MRRSIASLLVGTAVALSPLVGGAHVGVASGPGFADTSQLVTFSVGHGCDGADTLSVEIEIPEGVLSVRPEDGSLGMASLTRNDAGDVTTVKWEKIESNVLDNDDNYYRLYVRFRVPNEPFTQIYFPAHQTCMAADGTITVVDWVNTTGEGDEEPAPAMTILPPRMPGWNQYTVPADIDDLSMYFSDAVIVWRGSSAYSPNPNVQAQIADTDGVKELTTLEADDEIWVKY